MNRDDETDLSNLDDHSTDAVRRRVMRMARLMSPDGLRKVLLTMAEELERKATEQGDRPCF